MRTLWLLAGLLAPALAVAESRKTTVEVTVRKRAGAKAAAITVVPAGTDVEVVREDGRWVVIRVKGGEGYVPRTTLTAAAAAPATSVWSASRRGDGGLVLALYVDVTAATATLRADRTPQSAALATLARGAKIEVIDGSDPEWIHGRDGQGHDGWIARREVTEGAVSGASGDLRGSTAAEPAFDHNPTRKLEVRFAAGVGFRSLGMELTSNQGGGLTNYVVDADAAAATLAVDALFRPAGAWLVGVDGSLETSLSSPGIDYPGPTSASGKVPFETIAADLGVRAGRRVRGSVELSVRLGAHYDAFITRDVDNAGMLPRERLAGVTAGARVELRPSASRIGATLFGDVLVAGSRAQTPGLEDGTSNTAHAAWGGLTVRIALTRRWAVFGAYEFARMSTTWSGMSSRQPGVTSTRRTDIGQLAQLGIGAEL
jgi:uncharacterized protein YgiM (DUF1202 family)